MKALWNTMCLHIWQVFNLWAGFCETPSWPSMLCDSCRPQVPKECRRPVEDPEMLSTACSRECKNGHCTPTGKCCCSAGWDGPFCLRGTEPIRALSLCLWFQSCINLQPLSTFFQLISAFACHSQPNANPPVVTVGSAWSPTSVSARKDSPVVSARKESEEHEGTVRKTASWSTSLTWRLTCWTSPVILYKKQGRMIMRSSPVGRLNVMEAFQSLPSGHHPQSPTAPHLILLSHHCSFSWATAFDLHASLHHLHSHTYAQIHR